MKPPHLQTLLLSVLLVSCASQSANAQSADPVFLVSMKNEEDRVEVQIQDGAALVDIHSPSGIGSATFRLDSGQMPGEITVRLHLAGLEEVRLRSDQDEVTASISSADGSPVGQRLLSEGSELPILPTHPLWMKIEVVSSQEPKSVPLEEGYFEIQMPGDFIERSGDHFEIHWIDFYR